MRVAFLFILIILPFFTRAGVVINEIGWAGTKASASDEWVELFNDSDNEIDLTGWMLRAKDGAPLINLSGKIAGFGFYLIERTSDATISDILADYAGSFGKYGNLSNSGEDLELVNNSGEIIDRVNFSSGWPAGEAGPDYFSMERLSAKKSGSDKENWKTNDGKKISGKDAKGNNIYGTPKLGNNAEELTEKNEEKFIFTENKETESDKKEKSIKIIHKESSIKPYAGENKLGIAGADIEFKAKAYGEKDELISSDKLRFIWNFGDGFSKEGVVVKHSFVFPGTYIVMLDASKNDESSSDKILVKVIPNNIIISEVSPYDSWIEIYNGSVETLDISYWKIEHNGNIFVFPKNSFIKEKTYLTIPNSVSNIKLEKNGEVKFLYPNSVVAQKFSYGENNYNENLSFSLIGEKIVLSAKTPGGENKQAEILKELKSSINKSVKQKTKFIKKKQKSKVVKMCEYKFRN